MSSGSRSRASSMRSWAPSFSAARRSCAGRGLRRSGLRDRRRGFRGIAPEIVVDLSDEPIADPPRRFRIASRVLARACPTSAFRFDPVRFEPFSRPALAVIGTPASGWGRRRWPGTSPACSAGSSSWSSRWAGAAQEPVVVDREPEINELLELSRAGSHAASDYLEGAAFASVVTVGAAEPVEAPGRGAVLLQRPCRPSWPPRSPRTSSSSKGAGPRSRPSRPASGSSSSAPRRIRRQSSAISAPTACSSATSSSSPAARSRSPTRTRSWKLRRAIAEGDVPVLQTIFRPRPVSDVSGPQSRLLLDRAGRARAPARASSPSTAPTSFTSLGTSLARELRADLASLEARSADSISSS